MMHYINIEKKRLCGRNNQTIPPLIVDYSTVENVEFTFINSQNQIQPLEAGLSGLYFAGSLKMGDMSSNLLFLSKDYTISGNVLTFRVDTYTQSYLQQIRKKNTEINIEIGQIALDTKQVLLRDYALANPRVYVAGLSPAEIESNDYYTKEETLELLDGWYGEAKEYTDSVALELSGAIDGKVDTLEFNSAMESIENEISEISGSIEGFATTEYVDAAVSGKASKDEMDAALENINGNISTLSGDVLGQADDISELSSAIDAIVVPTKVSELDNDSGFATSGYVDGQVSGKADQSTLTAHTSDTEIHTTALEKAAWYAKQNAITADNKLDYALLSGTPAIPTKTSDLTNDSGFATSGYVDDGLALKQDIIDEMNPISGNAVLITYDPWLGDPEFTAEAAINMTHAEALQAQEDATQANADIQIVSGALTGKMDIPSGGTVGQVVTKTAYGAEWADTQGGESIEAPINYFRIWYDSRSGSYSGNLTFSFVKNNAAQPDPDLSFSTDKGNTWTKMEWNGGLSGTFMTPHSTGEIWAIYIKGNNDGFQRLTLKSNTNNSLWASVAGNIMTLLDETGKSKYVPDPGFNFLFYTFSMLRNASNLKLPATRLGNQAYSCMFYSCSNLTVGPYELPALELGEGAYYNMFYGCTSLVKTPKIKAIFWNSLTVNSNDKKAFGYMFNNCTSLSSVNVDFDDWRYTPGFSSYSNFTNWLNNVAASGQFICPYGLDTSTRDASYVPAGWELVYKEVPESILSGITATEAALTMQSD